MPTLDPEAVIIRAATSADLPTLGRLAALLVRTHHDFDHARFIAITAFEQAGATQAVLSAAARNESAQRLFARHGFRQTMIEMTRDV